MRSKTLNTQHFKSLDDLKYITPIQITSKVKPEETKKWLYEKKEFASFESFQSSQSNIQDRFSNVDRDTISFSVQLANIISKKPGEIKMPPDGYDEDASGFQASGLTETIVQLLSASIFITAADLLLKMGALDDDENKKDEVEAFLAMCLGGAVRVYAVCVIVYCRTSTTD